MKKKASGLFLAVCAGSLLLLSACGGKTAASPSASAAPSAGTSAEASGAAQTVKPLDETLSVDALDDCTFAASFQASDVTQTNGQLQIRLAVCDHESYDLVDISKLAAGDTLVVEGKNVAVTSVDRSGSDVLVNGGTEAGGYDLHTDDEGVYYVITMDAGPTYHTVGETTLTVGQDFVYTDNSDPQNSGKKSNASDFLTAMQGSSESFSANATTVRVAGGKIVELTRNYMP